MLGQREVISPGNANASEFIEQLQNFINAVAMKKSRSSNNLQILPNFKQYFTFYFIHAF